MSAANAASRIVCASEEEWLAARRGLVMASEIATILALADDSAPWAMTPADLWAQKTGLAPRIPDGPEMAEYRYWGHAHEPAIKRAYEDRTGRALTDLGAYTITLHPSLPWLGATLDVLADHEVFGLGPVQVKTSGSSQRGKWFAPLAADPRWGSTAEQFDDRFKGVLFDNVESTRKHCAHRHKTMEAAEECAHGMVVKVDPDRGTLIDDGKKIPDPIRVQVLFEIAVAGAEWGGVACLLGGNRFIQREMEPGNIADEINQLHTFWRHVVTKTPLDQELPEAA